jgi:RIO-like serine/threonine protein kinase
MSRLALVQVEDPLRIGGYWLAGRLGAGGQAVAYEAYDGAGSRVAVKVLRSGGSSGQRHVGMSHGR